MKPSELFQLKIPTPSGMSSAEWDEIAPQIRDQAFFSARVEEQRILDALKDKLTRIIRNELDPSEFRRDMRSFLDSIGYDPDEGAVGTIKDLRTQARLDLIRKINVGMARGYKQWRQFTTPAALEEFPAQRLVRRQRRNIQRDWLTRWQVAAQAVGWDGVYRGNDMVALKSSPIWVQLSRFGHPYPPFDFNSGMGTENVSIDECIKMGFKEAEKKQTVPEAKLSPEEEP